MPDSVARLVHMLDEDKSYDEIYRAMVESDMVDGIADVGCFEDPEVRVLLHSMSRKMLRSVLMKTLGPDLYDPDFSSKANWEQVLGSDGPGAYVVFVHVRERKGRFLCAREIRQLTGLLLQYALAVDAYQAHRLRDVYGGDQLGDGDKAAMLQAMEIDDALRATIRHDLDNPRFDTFEPRWRSSTWERQVERGRDVSISEPIRDFVKMLEKRLIPGADQETYQMQSPLMVGNAGHIDKRAQSHIPAGSLNNTPNVWGLLLSCLRVMDVEFEVRFATLFRAWEGGKQVNQAEILGTALAGSMLSVDGCNAKQPGTRGPGGSTEDLAYQKGKERVFAGRPWFSENLRRSLAYRAKPMRDALRPAIEILEKGNTRLAELRSEIDQHCITLGISRAGRSKAGDDAEGGTEDDAGGDAGVGGGKGQSKGKGKGKGKARMDVGYEVAATDESEDETSEDGPEDVS